MISNRELKEEIELLTKQNQALSDEIKQLKDMLKKQAGGGGQGTDQSDDKSFPYNNHSGRGDPGQQQGQSSDPNSQGQGKPMNGQNGQSLNAQSGQQMQQQSNNPQFAQIAGEFLQLKGLASSLELKVNNFISSQTGGGQLRPQDVAYLILNMMNGMIDWTIEYISRAQSGGQPT